METKNLICIECPRGCGITLFLEDGKVLKTEGNFCLKGETYAKNEIINPVRVVTTTVRLLSGEMLPVKTDKGVPKTEVINIVRKISKISINKPVKSGDIIIENIDKNGANVIATKSIL